MKMLLKRKVLGINPKTKRKLFKQFTLVAALIWFLAAMPFHVFAYDIDSTNTLKENPVYVNQTKDVKNVPIKYEITSLREKDSKVFLKADGLYEKAVYQEDVHYLKDGKWTDIDNRLELDSKNNEYLRVISLKLNYQKPYKIIKN